MNASPSPKQQSMADVQANIERVGRRIALAASQFPCDDWPYDDDDDWPSDEELDAVAERSRRYVSEQTTLLATRHLRPDHISIINDAIFGTHLPIADAGGIGPDAAAWLDGHRPGIVGIMMMAIDPEVEGHRPSPMDARIMDVAGEMIICVVTRDQGWAVVRTGLAWTDLSRDYITSWLRLQVSTYRAMREEGIDPETVEIVDLPAHPLPASCAS